MVSGGAEIRFSGRAMREMEELKIDGVLVKGLLRTRPIIGSEPVAVGEPAAYRIQGKVHNMEETEVFAVVRIEEVTVPGRLAILRIEQIARG